MTPEKKQEMFKRINEDIKGKTKREKKKRIISL